MGGARGSGGLAATPWLLRAAAATAALGLVGIGSLAAAPTASAIPDDGLIETTDTRYEVDGEGPIEVTVTATIQNDKPDSGSYYYFWNSYGVPVPESATDIVATSGGSRLSLSTEAADDPTYSISVASFGSLMYGQKRTIVWTYTIPGDPIRSDSYTRVGPGYATFAVVGSGDDGNVSIEIVTPRSMTFDSTWDGFTSSDDGDTRVHRSTESQDDYGTVAYVSVRDPDQADTSQVTAGEDTLTLSSFPGDEDWTDFVTTQVTEGLPLLEETIGQPWPGGVDTIRKDVSPEVLGYAWFDPGSGEIVVPEDLDAALLMHELSHAWLNDQSMKGRWLYEGLAEFVGQRVAAETSGEQTTYDRPNPDGRDAIPLTSWSEVELTDGTSDAETYGYSASYTAMVELLGDLDDDALAALIAAAYAGESAYAGPDGDVESQRTNWQRFLDLAEAHGVDDADDTYRTWVVDDDQAQLLDEREPALASYLAVDEADGAWVPPLGLRTAMTDWSFDDATSIAATLGSEGDAVAADALASTAAEVQDAAATADLEVPAAVQDRYEDADSAEDYAALATFLPQAVEVVGNVGEASAAAGAEGNPFVELGQRILSVDASAADARESLADGDLDAAGAAADSALDRAGYAPWLGGGVLVALLGALAGLVVVVVRARRRPRPAVATGPFTGGPVGYAHATYGPGGYGSAGAGGSGYGSAPAPGGQGWPTAHPDTAPPMYGAGNSGQQHWPAASAPLQQAWPHTEGAPAPPAWPQPASAPTSHMEVDPHTPLRPGDLDTRVPPPRE